MSVVKSGYGLSTPPGEGRPGIPGRTRASRPSGRRPSSAAVVGAETLGLSGANDIREILACCLGWPCRGPTRSPAAITSAASTQRRSSVRPAHRHAYREQRDDRRACEGAWRRPAAKPIALRENPTTPPTSRSPNAAIRPSGSDRPSRGRGQMGATARQHPRQAR